MLTQTVTHYFPHDESDDRDPIAYCGHRVRATDTHATQPTCAVCAETLDAEDALDALLADTPLPLDADEARTELDPILNAGLPIVPAARQPRVADDLFAYAAALAYAARRVA